MSLIQEALRRQHEDSGKGPAGAAAPVPPKTTGASVPPPVQGGTATVPPPVPPPVPTPSTAQDGVQEPDMQAAESELTVEEEAPRRQKSVLVGVLVGVLLLAGAAVLLGWFAVQRMRTKAGEQLTAAVGHALTNVVASVATNQPAVAVAPAPATVKTASPATNVVAAPSQNTPAVHVETTTAGVANVAAPAAGETGAIEPVKPVVRWPTLTLKAVINRGQGKGVAFINGKPFEVDDDIEGVRVVSFGEQCVYLEFRGEKRTLRVGGTTQ